MESDMKNSSRPRSSSCSSLEREARKLKLAWRLKSHSSSTDIAGNKLLCGSRLYAARHMTRARSFSNQEITKNGKSQQLRRPSSRERRRLSMKMMVPERPMLKDEEVVKELSKLMMEAGDAGLAEFAPHFINATRCPPITKQSLSELDINSIVGNSKLRHDVNFDRELHFRPNLDGAKGKLKKDAQKAYWQAIAAELALYRLLHRTTDEQLKVRGLNRATATKGSQRRLPTMFKTIKDILKNLVPDRDQSAVNEFVDVDIIMQEIEKDVCDFVNIAQWLAQLLKRHCAPMRDDMVDQMVSSISKGDAKSVSTGLRELFGALEAMKLDVANHQIRHLRALLIDDTVNFEQTHHFGRMERGRVRGAVAREWFLRNLNLATFSSFGTPSSNADFKAFLFALVRQLMPTTVEQFPDTFNLDQERLRLVRAEIKDAIYQNISYEIFEALVAEIGKTQTISQAAEVALRNSMLLIAGTDTQGSNGAADSGGRFAALDVGNIAVELVRHALKVSGIESTYDSRLVEIAELELRVGFSDDARLLYWSLEIESELLAEVNTCAEKHFNTSTWDIFNALVTPVHSSLPPPPIPSFCSSSTPSQHPIPLSSIPPPPPPPPPYPPPTSFSNNITETITNSPIPRLNGLVRRITHIAVLHWRVWAPLVYANDKLDISQGQDRGTPSRSPTPGQVLQSGSPDQKPRNKDSVQDMEDMDTQQQQQPDVDTCDPTTAVR